MIVEIRIHHQVMSVACELVADGKTMAKWIAPLPSDVQKRLEEVVFTHHNTMLRMHASDYGVSR